MTLIDAARGLVRVGRADRAGQAQVGEPQAGHSRAAGTNALRALEFEAIEPIDEPQLEATSWGAYAQDAEYVPGMADLEAAVGLVSAGLATRVVLTGFLSWPGLLWHAYRLAESADVLILPTLARGSVVRPGGRVDIVITRDLAANG